ncbi:MAG: DUF1080 domain-containing protein [Chitinophagaceae bacterium]|nr:DUF1080 domain-containing protein [Chitinophagaceae bacterium]
MKAITLLFSLSVLIFQGCSSPAPSAPVENDDTGFVRIFNGTNLDGWKGDTVYWHVEDSNLVGEITPATLLKRNSFITWQGGEVKDFELKFDFRITANGNSGINYRSVLIDSLPFAMKGYQGDIDGQNRHTGMNYEERARTTLAQRGQKVTLPPVPASDSLSAHIKDNVWSAAVVESSLGNADSLLAAIHPLGSWNEYHIVARGNHLQHFVNGVLMSDVTDNDSVNGKSQGLIGVQVHVGPPMKVEFRNFFLKKIEGKKGS